MRVMAMGLALAASGLGACSAKKADEAARADANAAGFVPPSVTSRLDYGTAQERRFARFDRNGDGILTATEMPRTDSRLLTLDRNGDGRITAIEFSEGTMARFDAMDLNRDGSLTSDERVEAQAAR